jgi:hypothetical protein
LARSPSSYHSRGERVPGLMLTRSAGGRPDALPRHGASDGSGLHGTWHAHAAHANGRRGAAAMVSEWWWRAQAGEGAQEGVILASALAFSLAVSAVY